MLKHPRDFGRKRTPAFVEETPENSGLYLARWHSTPSPKRLIRARRARNEHGDLSAATGLEYHRLTRILRGSAIMRVEDIGMISRGTPDVYELGVTDMVELVSAPTQHD
jgi:hypothetical protein